MRMMLSKQMILNGINELFQNINKHELCYDIVSASDIVTQQAKSNSSGHSFDYLFSIKGNIKLRYASNITETSSGDIIIEGNVIQGLQLARENEQFYWCQQLNKYLYGKYNAHEGSQKFILNASMLIYGFASKYSEIRRFDLDKLSSDINNYLLNQLQFGCLPAVLKDEVWPPNAWPTMIDLNF